jgi:hypothetical protein
MPCLSIQTNRTLRDEQQTELLNKALEIVASQLGKPQRYVMVSLAEHSALITPVPESKVSPAVQAPESLNRRYVGFLPNSGCFASSSASNRRPNSLTCSRNTGNGTRMTSPGA